MVRADLGGACRLSGKLHGQRLGRSQDAQEREAEEPCDEYAKSGLAHDLESLSCDCPRRQKPVWVCGRQPRLRELEQRLPE